MAAWDAPEGEVQVTRTRSPGSWAATARWSWEYVVTDVPPTEVTSRRRLARRSPRRRRRGPRPGWCPRRERDTEERVVPEGDRRGVLARDHTCGDAEHAPDRDDVPGDPRGAGRGRDVHPHRLAGRRQESATRVARDDVGVHLDELGEPVRVTGLSSETVIAWAWSVTVPPAAVSAPPSPPASPTAVTSSPTETPLASVGAVARPDASSSWSTATSRLRRTRAPRRRRSARSSRRSPRSTSRPRPRGGW